MKVKILIADDHEVVRTGLHAWFEGTDVEVIAQASDGEEALRLIAEHQPNVALIDALMPGVSGFECLERLKQDGPGTPVLMLCGDDNPTYTARASALGAAGFLFKTTSREALLEAVRRVASGEPSWPQEVVRRMSGSMSSGANGDSPLTSRECDVLRQLSFGLSNKEIAKALGISYETVKEHVQHILRKLNVNDRTQAAVWAVRNDLV